METEGLWQLFFATGLPEAYLAIRGQEDAALPVEQLSAKPAFGRKDVCPKEI